MVFRWRRLCIERRLNQWIFLSLLLQILKLFCKLSFLSFFGAERFLSSFSASSYHRNLSLFLKDVRSSLVDFVDCFSSIASWPSEGANFFFGRNTSLNLQVSGLPRFSNFIILATALTIGRTSKSFFVVLGFGTVTKRRATSKKAYRLQWWVEENRYLPLRCPGIESWYPLRKACVIILPILLVEGLQFTI